MKKQEVVQAPTIENLGMAYLDPVTGKESLNSLQT